MTASVTWGRSTRSARAFARRESSMLIRSSRSSGAVRWFSPITTNDTVTPRPEMVRAQQDYERKPPACERPQLSRLVGLAPNGGSCRRLGSTRFGRVLLIEGEDLELGREIDLAHGHVRRHVQ